MWRPQQPNAAERHKQPAVPDAASLRRWFDAVDKDHSGHITVTELQAALADGGLNFSLGTVAAIIRQCDRTGSGSITFSEFERLHVFLATVQDAFGALPADRQSGRVLLDDVARGLSSLGYDLEPAVLRALLARFDPLAAGSMGLQEFLALTLFLRSSAATFKAFDPSSTGVVHLNFHQYIYAAVNST
ncbi:Programmed cell death protein 6 [Tetrabaena socialis]|uniref:Programmed cell death protein 6 n=1 Tax=Tetrabaena socialis TaxID=47790 RepID=A0A2J7ZTD6_9CHLO|nr:Programmed cell death protein 6 [Tetrabaena socialis]|eukprot:PNH03531.1 Programmed cell death protein 6 [Tetrabaena socialis]